LSSATLLRVCTVPVEVALAGANPELGERSYRLVEAERAMGEAGQRLADSLQRYVNERRTSRNDSKRLGALAGRLGKGLPLREQDQLTVRTLVRTQLPGLTAAVETYVRDRAILAEERCRISAEVELEPRRAARAVLEAGRGQADVLALLRHRDGELLARLERDSASGPDAPGKSERRRIKRFNEIIRRAAFRTVPRDWHTVVTSVAIADSAAAAGHLTLGGDAAEVWIENIDTMQKTLGARAPSLSPDALIAMAALYRSAGDRISFYAAERSEQPRLRSIEVRRTGYLNAILAALHLRPLTFEALGADLALRQDELELLDGFVHHLVGLGILQMTRAPRIARGTWAPVAASPEAAPPAGPQSLGYLDVYANCRGGLPRSRALELQAGFQSVARIARAIAQDSHSGALASSTESIAPAEAGGNLLDIVCAHLEAAAALAEDRPGEAGPAASDGQRAAGSQERRRPSGGWAPPASGSTVYAKLIELLGPRLETRDCISIGSEDLDGIGAARWEPSWPCDAMIRLASGGGAFNGLFDEAFPAGSMDARFVSAMRSLGLATGYHDWYSRFLDRLQDRGGKRFVELLFPPLSVGAANAVRRPPYLRAWTGDTGAAAYFTSAFQDLEYLPLERFQLRRTPKGMRLAVDGETVFPLYHATRLPIPPWTVLTHLFLNAAPAQMRWGPRQLHRLLDAFPGRDYAPRLLCDGGLVISCRQWRLRKSRPLEPCPIEAMHAAERLRRELDLPRLVFLSEAPGKRPIPCDLRTFEGMCRLAGVAAEADDPIVMEMTPSPEDLMVKDAAGLSRQSCALLRLPLDIEPEAFADFAGERLE